MDNIDLIVYINLDHRADRKEELEKEFERLNVDKSKVVRISGINYILNGIGCSLSHIKALEYIQELDPECKLKNFLILEDDFSFNEDPEIVRNSLEKFFVEEANKVQWNVILLSYQVKRRKAYNELLSQVFESLRTDAYLVNRAYLPKLLENYRTGVEKLKETGQHWIYMVDMYRSLLMREGGWFYFNVYLGYQRSSASDLASGAVVEYRSVVEDGAVTED